MKSHDLYEWDERKRSNNLRKHGADFALVQGFDWDSALIREDTRQNYGEERFISIGYIAQRLYAVAWTPRGDKYRIISLRKANPREESIYDRT